MPWKPDHPSEFPTLGWLMLDWYTAYLGKPETQEYEPLVLTREQAEFVLRFYELNPVTGKRIIRRGVLSRPRGHGKSPVCAGISIGEGLGPVVFDGWDADGKPVGRPLSDFRKPLIEIAAVSEDQVSTNTWSPLIDMIDTPAIYDEYPGTEPMQTFVNLPYGKIQKRTAEARSAKGAPAWFILADQTESWTTSNGGKALYKTIKNNATKRGGHLLESPNAFTPGGDSVAEDTMAAYESALAGKTKLESGVYYDHREAPPETDLSDRESLLHGLAVAYGDSADIAQCVIHDPPCERPGWVDLEFIADSIWDPDTDIQLARSDWLNQVTHATDSWLSQPVWAACTDTSKVIADRDTITLGFDGSRGRFKGKPDATALIGCRVNDGHIWEIGIWEAGSIPSHDPQSTNPPKKPGCTCWKCWEPPIVEIEAALHTAFTTYNVVAFNADPGKDWRSHINAWEQKYSSRVQVRRNATHPFEWWMTGGRSSLVERAILALEGAIRNRDITHGGSLMLTRHVLNARRRLSHGKLALAKENDYSPNKIDASVAAVLAYQARLDALSQVVEETSNFYVPQRLY